MKESIRTLIEKATVKVTAKIAQGVLIEGNMILTAAHCIDWDCDGNMAGGMQEWEFVHQIVTAESTLKAIPFTVEAVSDVALLGPLDAQECPEEAERFEDFCEHTKPVPLFTGEIVLFEPIPIFIYTHKGKWLTGNAILCQRNGCTLVLKTDEPIEGGTSGSPVVNEHGELLGIVSRGGPTKQDEAYSGTAPRPHLALPVWAVYKILKSDPGIDIGTELMSAKKA